MRLGDFERTIVWSEVTFERTLVWSEVIFSAQSSGRWSGFCLGHGRTIVRTMVWLCSDQRSFPSGKVWSESVSSALRAHMVFRAHFSLIRGYFGLGWSDQRLLSSGTVWSEVTSGWHLNLGWINIKSSSSKSLGWSKRKLKRAVLNFNLVCSHQSNVVSKYSFFVNQQFSIINKKHLLN